MIRTLYGDVLLLIDFCMNFFILHTTGALLHRKTKVGYIAAAALFGGVYDLARLLVNGNDAFDACIGVAVGMLMCYITYGGYKFLKTVLTFFGIAALAGGSMIGVYYLLGSYHADLFGNIGGYAFSHIPLWLFAALAAVSLLLSLIFSYIGRESRETSQTEITIQYGERQITATVLLDSGNLVHEPLSGKSVILLPYKTAASLLPQETLRAIERKDGEYLLSMQFRLIGVMGIGGERRICYGFLPDNILAKKGRHTVEIDAYVAVCDGAVLESFDGVMHPECV